MDGTTRAPEDVGVGSGSGKTLLQLFSVVLDGALPVGKGQKGNWVGAYLVPGLPEYLVKHQGFIFGYGPTHSHTVPSKLNCIF